MVKVEFSLTFVLRVKIQMNALIAFNSVFLYPGFFLWAFEWLRAYLRMEYH
mgnify:FL=1